MGVRSGTLLDGKIKTYKYEILPRKSRGRGQSKGRARNQSSRGNGTAETILPKMRSNPLFGNLSILRFRCTGGTMKENYSETPRTDLAEENLRALGGAGYVRASHARELERELIVKSANYALAHSNLGREVTKCGQLT